MGGRIRATQHAMDMPLVSGVVRAANDQEEPWAVDCKYSLRTQPGMTMEGV